MKIQNPEKNAYCGEFYTLGAGQKYYQHLQQQQHEQQMISSFHVPKQRAGMKSISYLKDDGMEDNVMLFYDNYLDEIKDYKKIIYIYLRNIGLKTFLPFIKYCINLMKLDLSNNKINYLPTNNGNDQIWKYLPNLKVFYLHNNKIKKIGTVKTLQNIPNLEYLTLFGNPIELKTNYRNRVIEMLPNLKALDLQIICKLEIDKNIKLKEEFLNKLNLPNLFISKYINNNNVLHEFITKYNHYQFYQNINEIKLTIINEIRFIHLSYFKLDPVTTISRYYKGYKIRKQFKLSPKLEKKLNIIKNALVTTPSIYSFIFGNSNDNDNNDDEKIVNSIVDIELINSRNNNNQIQRYHQQQLQVQSLMDINRNELIKIDNLYNIIYNGLNELNINCIYIKDISKVYQLFNQYIKITNDKNIYFFNIFQLDKTYASLLNLKRINDKYKNNYILPFIESSNACIRLMNNNRYFKELPSIYRLCKYKYVYKSKCDSIPYIANNNNNIESNYLFKLYITKKEHLHYLSLIISILVFYNTKYSNSTIPFYFRRDISKISAAVTIQSSYRSYLIRKKYLPILEKKRAIMVIQKYLKGYIFRKRYLFIKKIKLIFNDLITFLENNDINNYLYINGLTLKNINQFKMNAFYSNHLKDSILYFFYKNNNHQILLKCVETIYNYKLNKLRNDFKNIFYFNKNYLIPNFIKDNLELITNKEFIPQFEYPNLLNLIKIGIKKIINIHTKKEIKNINDCFTLPNEDIYKIEYLNFKECKKRILLLLIYTLDIKNNYFLCFNTLQYFLYIRKIIKIQKWLKTKLQNKKKLLINDNIVDNNNIPVDNSIDNVTVDNKKKLKKKHLSTKEKVTILKQIKEQNTSTNSNISNISNTSTGASSFINIPKTTLNVTSINPQLTNHHSQSTNHLLYHQNHFNIENNFINKSYSSDNNNNNNNENEDEQTLKSIFKFISRSFK
ncbi:hypothetical protein ABK040_012576 [Willaertia magna]